MSIVPYNFNNEIVYHDPSHGILVLHNNQQNTFQLLSTVVNPNQQNNAIGNSNHTFPQESFKGLRFQGSQSSGHAHRECPNCGFFWVDYSSKNRTRSSEDSQNGLMDAPNVEPSVTSSLNRRFPHGFMHHDYFKLLGKLPYSSQLNFKPSNSLPDDIFNQGYFKRFFKKVPPYALGSGAHAQVYKVIHVLNDIRLGTYAVKRISIGDKYEFLEQVLNEVLILYELSVKGANENNLIRYNHVWLELGDIQDSSTYFVPDQNGAANDHNNKIPYVFILQQYCDGGHLEDLINKTFQPEKNLTMKQKVDLERQRRRDSRKQSSSSLSEKESKKTWLSDFEIWKFFKDVANGVHYLHSHGILHRDLKPSNCLLDVKFENASVKRNSFKDLDEFNREVLRLPKVLVSDFGEGKFIDKHRIPEQNLSINGLDNNSDRRGNTGTLEFTAPELWLLSSYDPLLRDEKQFINDFTYESDIYSLGLILCWLYVGSLPFSNIISNENDPQAIRNKIIEWYFHLDFNSFHQWFVESINSRGVALDEHNCMKEFENLIYLMIKGKDSNSVPNGGRPKRILSSDVLNYLEFIKRNKFIYNNDYQYRNNENFKSGNELSNDYNLVTNSNKISIQDTEIDPNEDELSDDEVLNLDIRGSDASDNIPLDLYLSSIHMKKETAIRSSQRNFERDDYLAIIIYTINIVILDFLAYDNSTKFNLALKVINITSFATDLLCLRSSSLRTLLLLINSLLIISLIPYHYMFAYFGFGLQVS